MSGTAVVGEIVSILVSGITDFAAGLGQGISDLARALFFETTGTGADATTTISIFGVLIICFASISLCVGLSRLIFHWLTSLGSRN